MLHDHMRIRRPLRSWAVAGDPEANDIHRAEDGAAVSALVAREGLKPGLRGERRVVLELHIFPNEDLHTSVMFVLQSQQMKIVPSSGV